MKDQECTTSHYARESGERSTDARKKEKNGQHAGVLMISNEVGARTWRAQLVTKQKKEPWYGEKERTCDTVREEIDREIKETCLFLARFYIKEGMSDIERWHNKLAHQGTKILARCNIRSL